MPKTKDFEIGSQIYVKISLQVFQREGYYL